MSDSYFLVKNTLARWGHKRKKISSMPYFFSQQEIWYSLKDNNTTLRETVRGQNRRVQSVRDGRKLSAGPGPVPWDAIPPPPAASVLRPLPLSVFYHFLSGIRSPQSSLEMFEWDSNWDNWGNHKSHWTKIHVFIHLFMEVCSIRRKGKITKKPLLFESEVLGFSFFSVATSKVSTSLLHPALSFRLISSVISPWSLQQNFQVLHMCPLGALFKHQLPDYIVIVYIVYIFICLSTRL